MFLANSDYCLIVNSHSDSDNEDESSRSHQLLSYSRISQIPVELKGSLCSQEPTTVPVLCKTSWKIMGSIPDKVIGLFK
jgi:hypothetical protein